jgi:hypothetical protein
MTDNIFNNADPATTTSESTPQTTTTPQAPVIPPELTEYVGVGKKYASIDEVYKAFPNAQKHISTLESDLAAAREELAKRRTTEELLNDIQAGLATPQTATTVVEAAQPQDISAIVRNELAKKQNEDVALSNQTTVVAEFQKVYGDKAQVEFEKIASDLGVPITSLNQLAATSPNAVFKLAGIQAAKPTKSGSLESNINVTSFTPAKEVPSARASLNGNAKEDAAAIAIAREYVMKKYK